MLYPPSLKPTFHVLYHISNNAVFYYVSFAIIVMVNNVRFTAFVRIMVISSEAKWLLICCVFDNEYDPYDYIKLQLKYKPLLSTDPVETMRQWNSMISSENSINEGGYKISDRRSNSHIISTATAKTIRACVRLFGVFVCPNR